MAQTKRILIPIGAGLLAAIFLAALYLGIVSWAESPKHALELFWEDRWLVIPIITGFGIQAALYVTLKKRLFVPTAQAGASGALTGASGATSTIAMVGCCAHHVTDVLSVLGLTAAAAFLAEYQIPFMVVGLLTNLIGITVMLSILLKERQKALRIAATPLTSIQGD
jgi:Cu+-exporting ATPase